MEIKILGPSCVNCLKLELSVAQALKELGREGKIVKVAEAEGDIEIPGEPTYIID